MRIELVTMDIGYHRQNVQVRQHLCRVGMKPDYMLSPVFCNKDSCLALSIHLFLVTECLSSSCPDGYVVSGLLHGFLCRTVQPDVREHEGSRTPQVSTSLDTWGVTETKHQPEIMHGGDLRLLHICARCAAWFSCVSSSDWSELSLIRTLSPAFGSLLFGWVSLTGLSRTGRAQS